MTEPLSPAEIRRLARIHAMPCPGCGAQFTMFFAAPPWISELDLSAWEIPRARGEFDASFCRAPHAGPRAQHCPSCGLRIVLISQRSLPAPISSLVTIEDWEERARKLWGSWDGKVLSDHAVEIAKRARSLLEQSP